MKKRKEALQGATDFHYENFLRRSRYTSVFLVLLAAFCVITVLNINTGNVDISIPKILKIIFLREGNKMEYNIIWKIRLPRILMAAILGGALSLSGFLLQTFFENPIAGPFVLGISSGAKMVVALAMIYFLGRFQVVSSYTLIIAAFIGSLIATGFILLVSRRINHMATLLVAGIMIGYITSSAISLLNFFATAEGVHSYMIWGMGNFGGVSLQQLPYFSIFCLAGLLLSILLIKPLNALLLGTRYAENLGVNIRRTRNLLLIATGLLTAVTTAFCGPVAFIGLAVPHISRLMLGTSNHNSLLPITLLTGGVIALLCNLICILPGEAGIIPLNAVTPVLGAPVIIYVIVNQRKIQYFN